MDLELLQNKKQVCFEIIEKKKGPIAIDEDLNVISCDKGSIYLSAVHLAVPPDPTILKYCLL